MPTRLEIPMLSVDAERMRDVDTRNAENLFGIWSVFSKCADSVEDGKRLANMSWRIWNRETLCCETQPGLATTPPIDIARSRPQRQEVPELSASVDSLSSNDSDTAEETQQSPTPPVDIEQSQSPRSGASFAASRGRERHITSLGLERMIYSIKDKRGIEPLSPTIADAIPSVLPSNEIAPQLAPLPVNAPYRSSDSSSSTALISSASSDNSATQTVGSETSTELSTSHSIVRGFSPGHISSSYRSRTHLAPSPLPTKSVVHAKPDISKEGGFLLGGSSGEDESSMEESVPQGKSSLSWMLSRPAPVDKKLSFRDEVESRNLNNKSHEDEEVFESSDEEEDAIEDDSEDDDDDDEDWEDDASESAENTVNTTMFQRVDSQPNLVSRRSLLTSLMHQSDRAAAFANMASRSTPALRRSRTSTPAGPSVGTSPKEEDEDEDEDEGSTLTMGASHMTPSKPIIMNTSNNNHMAALSPRSTRRNMLATEMTESLRKHLIWERQQKKATSHAVLKRRHTANNLVNLGTHPGQHVATRDYFSQGLGEYHEAGW